jgi:hypothetical protein
MPDYKCFMIEHGNTAHAYYDFLADGPCPTVDMLPVSSNGWLVDYKDK